MKNNATIDSLKAMRFGAMAAELERQMQDASTYAHMGFEERIALLVDAEWNSRQNNKLIRCIRDARFAEPNAVVEDIEYNEDRHLDKAQLLRFATCDFISKGHHIIFKGASGNGKTYLACAMGNSACRIPNPWNLKVFCSIRYLPVSYRPLPRAARNHPATSHPHTDRADAPKNLEVTIMSNNIDYVYSPEHDFYIPRLTPPESPKIGKYGRMRLRYLKHHK